MTSEQPSLFDGDESSANELKAAAELWALTQLPGIGNARALRLSSGFASWDELVDASPAARRQVAGAEIDYVPAMPVPRVPEGVQLCGYFDDDYPDALRAIKNPPVALWVRGEIARSTPSVAVVGAREASDWAIQMAGSIAADASELGVAVVSGLAFGIDIAAHRSALTSGGRTIAVLGSGVDVPTPREHLADAERILETGGALISEVPLGSAPNPRTLVARNRIQSGLSFATIVVECGLKSGTMQTAKFAVEQGRRLCVPSPEAHDESEMNAGSRSLLDIGVGNVAAERLRSREDLHELLRSAAS
ncbi:DNA processing protein [Aeromicrobium panaciterrae]|uniref:DNA processing protein n=1 Tax=Aeromicrobium panaciterrae TaxID=363861 RepID=A0ABU1UNR6_9ACTN|nr:DNA processing protein [Aeromicrobium panaciterrae]